MPALPSSNPTQFVQCAPVLHVADVFATAAFYRDVLGFTWDFGDDAYAVVWRDNSAIHSADVQRQHFGMKARPRVRWPCGTLHSQTVR